MIETPKPLTFERASEIKENLVDLIESCMIAYDKTASIPGGLAKDLQVYLNQLIESDGIECTQFLITSNTDKQMFGTYILPNIADWDISRIVNDCDTTEPVRFHDFRIELDARLFNGDYEPAEILAMILADTYGMMSPDVPMKLQMAIDAVICNTGRAASGYIIKPIEKRHQYQVMRYAMISFLRNLYTFAGDDQVSSSYMSTHIIQALDLERIVLMIYNTRDVALRGGTNSGTELNVFRWVFNLLDDIDLHLADAIDTLATIKSTTGSVLERDLLSSVIESLKSGVDMDSGINCVKESSVLEGFSLFKSLKMNGLRGIEDDLYEYKIRIKNCEDEEDAMYILRQINTRLTILDDYVRNTNNLSDNERARWQADIDAYRDLRYQLGQKKIGGKRQYGIFIDYDKLDQL